MSGNTTITSFSAISGQEKAKAFLGRMFTSGRLAHAYLFRGPDGVGKQLCAKVVAARLNCLQPIADGGCGRCSSCRKFVSGNHPDITIISPENGSIKIDRIRKLCRSLSYPPYESTMRVVVLEDVHTMRAEAANSLLKTLEEPPENNLLILTAESSREVLPTIISRCQVVPFYGLTSEQTIAILRTREPDIDDEEAEMLARLAEGSPGRALLLKEKGLVEIWRSMIDVVTARPEDPSEYASRLLQAAETMASLKENLLPLLGLIRIWIRDLMVEEGGRDLTGGKKQSLRLAALDRAERQLARNCNRALVCEVLLFNLQSPVPRVLS